MKQHCSGDILPRATQCREWLRASQTTSQRFDKLHLKIDTTDCGPLNALYMRASAKKMSNARSDIEEQKFKRELVQRLDTWQNEQCTAIYERFDEGNRRHTLVAPPGVGKTRVGAKLLVRLQNEPLPPPQSIVEGERMLPNVERRLRVLVLLPSLALFAQHVREYVDELRKANVEFSCVCVCSKSDILSASDKQIKADETMSIGARELKAAITKVKEDAIVHSSAKAPQQLSELVNGGAGTGHGWPHCGEAAAEEAEARAPPPLLVFCTYQSAKSKLSTCVFNLAIYDEVHRTCGVDRGLSRAKLASFTLSDQCGVHIERRLFVTATPRVSRLFDEQAHASEDDASSASRAAKETRKYGATMDCKSVYGELLQRPLSYRKARDELNVVAPFRVAIVLCGIGSAADTGEEDGDGDDFDSNNNNSKNKSAPMDSDNAQDESNDSSVDYEDTTTTTTTTTTTSTRSRTSTKRPSNEPASDEERRLRRRVQQQQRRQQRRPLLPEYHPLYATAQMHAILRTTRVLELRSVLSFHSQTKFAQAFAGAYTPKEAVKRSAGSDAGHNVGVKKTVSAEQMSALNSALVVERARHAEVAAQAGEERPPPTMLHINGAMSTAQREEIMQSFNERSRAARINADEGAVWLTNCKCIGEGVDIANIDAVAFCCRKSDPVEVVQNVGRCIRLAYAEKVGTVVVPVVCSLSDEELLILREGSATDEHTYNELIARAFDSNQSCRTLLLILHWFWHTDSFVYARVGHHTDEKHIRQRAEAQRSGRGGARGGDRAPGGGKGGDGSGDDAGVDPEAHDSVDIDGMFEILVDVADKEQIVGGGRSGVRSESSPTRHKEVPHVVSRMICQHMRSLLFQHNHNDYELVRGYDREDMFTRFVNSTRAMNRIEKVLQKREDALRSLSGVEYKAYEARMKDEFDMMDKRRQDELRAAHFKPRQARKKAPQLTLPTAEKHVLAVFADGDETKKTRQMKEWVRGFSGVDEFCEAIEQRNAARKSRAHKCSERSARLVFASVHAERSAVEVAEEGGGVAVTPLQRRRAPSTARKRKAAEPVTAAKRTKAKRKQGRSPLVQRPQQPE